MRYLGRVEGISQSIFTADMDATSAQRMASGVLFWSLLTQLPTNSPTLGIVNERFKSIILCFEVGTSLPLVSTFDIKRFGEALRLTRQILQKPLHSASTVGEISY
jgi:hypothetical protein